MLIREKYRDIWDIDTGRKSYEEQDWSYAATSQGMPRVITITANI